MKIAAVRLVALRTVARSLGPLCDDVVFVGGMVRGLLVTDPAASISRATKDVDVIIETASTIEYQIGLGERLREAGFSEDSREGAATCRWIVRGVTVDVMPTDPSVVGFSNDWYRHAIATAMRAALPPDDDGSVEINVISAPSFYATKLAAYASRGGGDPYHHDVEDIVAVADGRPELLDELAREPSELRAFVADALSGVALGPRRGVATRTSRRRSGQPGALPIRAHHAAPHGAQPAIPAARKHLVATSAGGPWGHG